MYRISIRPCHPFTTTLPLGYTQPHSSPLTASFPEVNQEVNLGYGKHMSPMMALDSARQPVNLLQPVHRWSEEQVYSVPCKTSGKASSV